MTTTNLIERLLKMAAHSAAGQILREAADKIEAQTIKEAGLLANIQADEILKTELRTKVEAQAKQIEALQADAQRYRHILESHDFAICRWVSDSGGKFVTAATWMVDEAIVASKGNV
jgi:hypothetical protein